MSSNIRINRICAHCGQDFIAKTSVTQYCGDVCAKKAYKARQRASNIEASKIETLNQKLIQIQCKMVLTPKEAATLLNCSVRSIYNQIQSGNIKATNLGKRLTRIKRSDIDERFENMN